MRISIIKVLAVGFVALSALPVPVLALQTWSSQHRTHNQAPVVQQAQPGTLTSVSQPIQLTPVQTTQPTAAVQSTTSGTLCMNTGYQSRVNGQYNWTQIDATFAKLKGAGFSCIRLDYEVFNDPNIEALGLRAKSDGLYVIIGGMAGTLSNSGLAGYDTGVIAEAKWAESNSMPQVSLGNEQESRLSGLSPQEWVQHLLSLATQVRKVYSGKISYEINSDDLPLWQQNGLGSIDLLGLNLYCGVGCNSDRIASAISSFGASHVYVSESNSDMETGRYNSDDVHATDVKNNFMVLHAKYPNIPIYYFNFLGNGDGTGVWAIYNGSAFVEPLTAAALGFK